MSRPSLMRSATAFSSSNKEDMATGLLLLRVEKEEGTRVGGRKACASAGKERRRPESTFMVCLAASVLLIGGGG